MDVQPGNKQERMSPTFSDYFFRLYGERPPFLHFLQ
ncbi:hypothetical protein NUACC26_001620 [Scytonema sp. NUACC26]